MQKVLTQLAEKKLVGITCRTNNAQLFESDPSTNKVAALVYKYFHGGFADSIKARKTPGTTYCVYTRYESDYTGDFTYFIGEEVSSFEAIVEGFESHTIPAQSYAKFTNEPGPMPMVCIDMWKSIWSMMPSDLGGERGYLSDFEVYDERSADHSKVTLDIYIGLKK